MAKGTKAYCERCGRFFRKGFSVCQRADCPFGEASGAAEHAARREAAGDEEKLHKATEAKPLTNENVIVKTQDNGQA